MPQERRAMAVMATAANWRIDIRKPSLHSEARDHQFLRGRPKIKQQRSGQSGTGESLFHARGNSSRLIARLRSARVGSRQSCLCQMGWHDVMRSRDQRLVGCRARRSVCGPRRTRTAMATPPPTRRGPRSIRSPEPVLPGPAERGAVTCADEVGRSLFGAHGPCRARRRDHPLKPGIGQSLGTAHLAQRDAAAPQGGEGGCCPPSA